MKLQLDPAFSTFILNLCTLVMMRPETRTFLYWSRAKILIHHGDRTDRKDGIDKEQAYCGCKAVIPGPSGQASAGPLFCPSMLSTVFLFSSFG